ncbi:hypothetical protein GcM3_033034 [Golovinomyces cichoracearum]|uniref:Uncharacterized protein n=1 Tax=Golovinomyces cichoracearum TaxID=62708 RepID=A0A420J4G7_9PEZI|nr:hypothetical protein GcM3_033034 [Golovinomyces cichoracearum]
MNMNMNSQNASENDSLIESLRAQKNPTLRKDKAGKGVNRKSFNASGNKDNILPRPDNSNMELGK